MEDRLVAALRRHLAGGRPVVPEGAGVLWRIFGDLSGTRQHGMGGPLPITFAEIEAYSRLHRWPLQPHHVATLRAMDDAWLVHAYSGQDGGKSAPRRSTDQKINPAAFDAVFG